MKIKMNHINKTIRKKEILHDISIDMDNHIYGLMGPNGSGKTTLMRCLLGLMPYQGSIEFSDDHEILKLSQLKIGYLPQIFDAFKDLTVTQQLEYFMTLKDIPESQHQEECQRVLELVHLTSKKEERCGNLSGGMIRRLGIAQALLGHPQLIIFDEPTAGLDLDERFRFKEILNHLHLNIPIILSTHIIEDISGLCSHGIFIKDGRVICCDEIEKLKKEIEGHIYSCDKDHVFDIHGNHLVRQMLDGSVRIISKDEMNVSFIKHEVPTIEDLYHYYIHGDAIEKDLS